MRCKKTREVFLYTHILSVPCKRQRTKMKCKQEKYIIEVWGETYAVLHTEVSQVHDTHKIFTQAKSNMCCFGLTGVKTYHIVT